MRSWHMASCGSPCGPAMAASSCVIRSSRKYPGCWPRVPRHIVGDLHPRRPHFPDGVLAAGRARPVLVEWAVEFRTGLRCQVVSRARSMAAGGYPHADWILIGAFEETPAGKGPLPRFALSVADTTPQSNWNVSGLAATASWDCVHDGVHVPDQRQFPAAQLLDATAPGARDDCRPAALLSGHIVARPGGVDAAQRRRYHLAFRRTHLCLAQPQGLFLRPRRLHQRGRHRPSERQQCGGGNGAGLIMHRRIGVELARSRPLRAQCPTCHLPRLDKRRGLP